jgi:hypothetical protein
MKTRPMAAELFQGDGQTDMTKIMTALHNIANAPKMGPIIRELNKINHNAFCYTDLSTAKMQSIIQQVGCGAA